ncbi:MAG: ERAP1-like C-terminal domain-containing protein [Polaromonas sp.]|nr:ERAP1-like C-terminal domain-containing protein [Polaromonas sp.]
MSKTIDAALLLALLALPAFTTAADLPAASFVTTTTQLPRDVRPTHYDLTITPDATALTFDGRAEISIEIRRPTRRITLNAADLQFSSASLMDSAGKRVLATPAIEIDKDKQTASFVLEKSAPAGRYRLALDYTGTIGTQAAGLFALDYPGSTGPRRALYTQFEAADARRVVPSWDEPAFRTSFSLTLHIAKGEMAVSNMPVAQTTELADGRQAVRFAPTPPMSTYLLFFAAGDFERRTMQVAGTEIGMITKRGSVGQADFALESSARVLREFNDYFGTPYPLPKLDNIAAPGSSQFFGAMENWGAILSFEELLLLDPSIATSRNKQRVFQVAAHEIAHQWFGNLVTMHWWDDLWLNEGFASWMEGRTTQKLHPEWNTALASVDTREWAMQRDALVTTHPVVQHIETVEQASQAFDSITYSKGEAVITMLEAYVGEEAWRKGVRRYLKKHAYGNTRSDDLWREIEAAAKQPVRAIAHEFTLQPGIPLITIGEPVCANGRSRMSLTQGEFTADRPDKKPLRWKVPVIASQAGAKEPVRLHVSRGKAQLDVPGCAPVIVNAGQTGYFRTLYSAKHFQSLAGVFGSLAPIDQLGLLSDTWALGRAGLQALPDYLDLALNAQANSDPQIWGYIARVFEELNAYYRDDKKRQARFQAFATRVLNPVLAQVGWAARPGEPDTVAILRNELIATLSALGDPAIIAEARRRHAAQSADPAAVPAALRTTILGVVARHATTADWDALRDAANNEKVALVRNRLFGLLASTEDKTLAQQALELALTAEPGETNSASMIARVSELHPELALDFALANHAEVLQKVETNSRSSYFPQLAFRSMNPATIDKLNAYAAKHVAADARRELETVIAEVTYRIKVFTERVPAVDAWLDRKRGS